MVFTKKKILIFSLALLVLLLAGFWFFMGKKPQEETKKTPKADDGELLTVLVQEFNRQDVPEYVQVSGVLQGIRQVEMVAGVSGRLHKLHKKMGDWVEKGQSIGDIDADVRQAEYEQAKALFAIAQSSMRAGKELYASQQISESEYQQILGEFASSKALLESKKIVYDYARMVAPVSGFITDLPVEEGESIGANELVCKVVDYKKLLLNAGVGESNILKIKKEQRVDVSPDGSDLLLGGKVIGVGKAPACNSAVYPVKIELPGGEELLPGMTVTAEIAVGEYKDVQAVVYDALVQKYDDFFVYRLNDADKTVSKVKVLVKKIVGNMAIVESPLKDGDYIVIDGVDDLEDGKKVSPNYYKPKSVQSDSEMGEV